MFGDSEIHTRICTVYDMQNVITKSTVRGVLHQGNILHATSDMRYVTCNYSDTTVHIPQLHRSCLYTNKIRALLFIVGYCLSFVYGKSAFLL